MNLRRAVMWSEAVVAGLLAAFGLQSVASGLLFGHSDRHGGIYSILCGASFLLAAAIFAVPALCLRGTSRSSWLPQLFPFAISALILWTLLVRPG